MNVIRYFLGLPLTIPMVLGLMAGVVILQSAGFTDSLPSTGTFMEPTKDATAGADASLPLLGIDKETYLGIIFQNAANPAFRLPSGAKPSEFFNKIDPTPGEPAINEVIRMPGYPKGSPFIVDGLMANSPGILVTDKFLTSPMHLFRKKYQ